eukprot:TRINITY_DN27804_c0_g1_i2.p1 TRINITY_DN27804_c0_g1~~TRINITY_DN27804_c0_g1_i2.p1  ORF type:complete len:121 (-),score=26.45 TRINITY_DN27804_c0_g1_i2:109-471(-)
MTACQLSVEEAIDEGITFLFGYHPVAIHGTQRNTVAAVECRLSPGNGTTTDSNTTPSTIIPATTVVKAISQSPESLPIEAGSGTQGLFAAGDCVTGSISVCHAMASAATTVGIILQFLES